MIETIKTKKRFIKLVNEMEYPILYTGSGSGIYASTYFLIKDREDNNKRFYLPGCKLYHNCTNQQIEAYEKKEMKLHSKYQNWLYDICGDYCETRRRTE